MFSSGPHILLVEGKGALADSLVHFLTKKWHNIDVVHTGNDALAAGHLRPPNVIIFDASTMRSSGVRICRRLRKSLPKAALIHVRSSGDAEDLNVKADVYLKRPFTARKLTNRVLLLLPPEDAENQIIRLGDFTLYTGKGAINIEGRGEFPLTPKLTALLELFMRNPQEIISRRELMEKVWETSYVGDTRTLDVHIRWTREIIEENAKKPQLLTTVRGVGYMLQIDPEAAAHSNGSK